MKEHQITDSSEAKLLQVPFKQVPIFEDFDQMHLLINDVKLRNCLKIFCRENMLVEMSNTTNLIYLIDIQIEYNN